MAWIITRGLGDKTLVTRGYGPLEEINRWRAEVFRTLSHVLRVYEEESKIASRD